MSGPDLAGIERIRHLCAVAVEGSFAAVEGRALLARVEALEADAALGANVRALVEDGFLGRIYRNARGAYVVQELGPSAGLRELLVTANHDGATLDLAVTKAAAAASGRKG